MDCFIPRSWHFQAFMTNFNRLILSHFLRKKRGKNLIKNNKILTKIYIIFLKFFEWFDLCWLFFFCSNFLFSVSLTEGNFHSYLSPLSCVFSHRVARKKVFYQDLTAEILSLSHFQRFHAFCRRDLHLSLHLEDFYLRRMHYFRLISNDQQRDLHRWGQI